MAKLRLIVADIVEGDPEYKVPGQVTVEVEGDTPDQNNLGNLTPAQGLIGAVLGIVMAAQVDPNEAARVQTEVSDLTPKVLH